METKSINNAIVAQEITEILHQTYGPSDSISLEVGYGDNHLEVSFIFFNYKIICENHRDHSWESMRFDIYIEHTKVEGYRNSRIQFRHLFSYYDDCRYNEWYSKDNFSLYIQRIKFYIENNLFYCRLTGINGEKALLLEGQLHPISSFLEARRYFTKEGQNHLERNKEYYLPPEEDISGVEITIEEKKKNIKDSFDCIIVNKRHYSRYYRFSVFKTKNIIVGSSSIRTPYKYEYSHGALIAVDCTVFFIDEKLKIRKIPFFSSPIYEIMFDKNCPIILSERKIVFFNECLKVKKIIRLEKSLSGYGLTKIQSSNEISLFYDYSFKERFCINLKTWKKIELPSIELLIEQ